MKHTASYIPEYPRPQFVRKAWVDLNGAWDFAFDKDGTGLEKGYSGGFDTKQKINVPFAYQVKASGIGDTELCEHIWYSRKLALDPKKDVRILLHLEGCDYVTHVWLNGKDCGSATGGYHRLTFDLTGAAVKGENTLVIGVEDSYSKEQPRGKQRWQSTDHGCWYIDTSGIYKSVWLEEVNACHIESARITPEPSSRSATVEFVADVPSGTPAVIEVKAAYGGKTVASGSAALVNGRGTVKLVIAENDMHLWGVGAPELYDLDFALKANGFVTDRVASYFGMREIKTEGGRVLLNGKPLYQKLVLDQGYWQDSGLTPPSEAALEHDIELMTEMGFNGCRKHEKIEDERFMYYADIYGYVMWCEMPSEYCLTEKSKRALAEEWRLVTEQMYNHPCIICWVCFNESWGIEDIKTNEATQKFVNDVYYAVKAFDGTRLVVTNDGWEHTVSDLLTVHHYTQSGQTLHDCFDTLEKCCKEVYAEHDRGAFADGYKYNGQPVMITEFGGTAFVKDAVGAKWGYGNGVGNTEEYVARFASLIEAIDTIPFVCGYCYTQLSDVYHEVNGLCEFDRTPKADTKTIARILAEKGR